MFQTLPGALICGCLAAPALAQVPLPALPMTRVISPEACPQWHTLMLAQYFDTARTGQRLYELQKGCFDEALPTLSGPEPVGNLTLRIEEEGMGRAWQNVAMSPADEMGRTTFNAGFLMTLYYNEVEALSIGLDIPNNSSIRHPDYVDMSAVGVAFKHLVDESAVDGRTWIGMWWAASVFRLNMPQADISLTGDLGLPTVLFDVVNGSITNVEVVEINRPVPAQDLAINLRIENGVAAGAMQTRFRNTLPVAGRVPNEWTSGAMIVPDLTGYLIGTADQPALALFGVGSANTVGPLGQVYDDVMLTLLAVPLPAGETRQSAAQGGE